jgi:transposase
VTVPCRANCGGNTRTLSFCPQGPQKNGGQAEQALGRSRGGFSAKIHLAVDGLGNPLRLHLTAGQRHHIIKAHDLTVDLAFDHLIADRSYGAKDLGEQLIARGIEVVIPPNKNAKQPREYDAWPYRERHLMEGFIGKFKHFRRVFSRFDTLAGRYWGFLQLTTTLIWVR